MRNSGRRRKRVPNLSDDLAKYRQLSEARAKIREVRQALEAEGFPQNAAELKKAEDIVGDIAYACYSSYGTEVPK